MTTADVVDTTAAKRTGSRISGIDVARALALLGMFIVHIDVAGQGEPVVEGVPTQMGFTVAKFWEGRAMPLFVLLSGVGLTLLLRSRGGRPAGVIGRAVVLLLLGTLMSRNNAGILVILDFYAVYLVVGLLAHRLRDRALLGFALAVAAVGVVIQAWPQPDITSVDEPTPLFGGLTALADLVTYVKTLVVTGAYPFFPDAAIFLVGMWVGRLRLDRARTAARMAAVGVALLALGLAIPAATASFGHQVQVATLAHQIEKDAGGMSTEKLTAYAELAGQNLEEFGTALKSETGISLAELETAARQPEPSVFTTKLAGAVSYLPHDHMPPWLLQATGGGLLGLGLCLLLAGRFPAIGSALVLGRFALSAYVAHWVFLLNVDSEWVALHGLATAVLLWLAFVVLAFGWSRWRTTGPVEALLRAGDWVAIKGADAVRSRRAVRAGG